MIEKKILEAALQDRSASSVIQELVSLDSVSDYVRHILTNVYEFYETDQEATSVDRELLKELLTQKYPSKHKELEIIIDELGTTSPSNVLKEIANLKKQDLSRELATELLSNTDSTKAMDLWAELTSPLLTHIEEAKDATQGLEELLQEVVNDDNRIIIYPKSLDSRLESGARHGNHIVVFARPNMGKTAFVINLIRGLLRDGRRVLYFMNEEPASQVLKRLVQRITNNPHDVIKGALKKAIAESEELLRNLYIKELTPGTFKEIYSMTNVIKPDVVIIDQLRNIRTREDNRVIALEHMAMEARALGKTHNCLVVSVTQAGDSARNKLVLDDGDIDFSNTGIPATADLIVGIGANQEYINSGKRMITIVKNKLGSDHSSFPVQIDVGLSKILGFK